MASLLNMNTLRQSLSASLMDGLYAQWNQIKTQVVTQIASNIIGATVSVDQIQQQTQQLQTHVTDLTQIFDQVTAHQDELFEKIGTGCLSSTKSIFGASVAETVSWMAALGLGVASVSGEADEDQTKGDATKGLSIVLFIVAQGISKFNDYNNYKKIHQYKTAQKGVLQAQEILKQRHLLATTKQITLQAQALLAPARSFEEQISNEEKTTRWIALQQQLKAAFDNPHAIESADKDSATTIRLDSVSANVLNQEPQDREAIVASHEEAKDAASLGSVVIDIDGLQLAALEHSV
jgi:hypothetical protein